MMAVKKRIGVYLVVWLSVTQLLTACGLFDSAGQPQPDTLAGGAPISTPLISPSSSEPTVTTMPSTSLPASPVTATAAISPIPLTPTPTPMVVSVLQWPPIGPPTLASAPLNCTTNDLFYQCEDPFLGITFDYPKAWGEISAQLGEDPIFYSYHYEYQFAHSLEYPGVFAGGRGRYISEFGRGRMLTDFNGYPADFANETCSTYSARTCTAPTWSLVYGTAARRCIHVP
jgi:hypothetical protein